MKTSIIICSYNRAELLRRALEALSCQTIPADQYEVIVVNDASTDHTLEVCRSVQAHLPRLRWITNLSNLGLSASANRGIQVSRGRQLLFTDDDCIPHPGWIAAMQSVLDQRPIVAGSIVSPMRPYFKLCHNIAQFHPFLRGRREGRVPYIAGANMGIRREVLENLEGFAQMKCLAPDMEFVLRARTRGYAVWLASQAIVTHDPDRTSFQTAWNYACSHARETIALRAAYRNLLRTPLVLRSALLLLLAAPLIAARVSLSAFIGNRRLLKHMGTFPVVFILKLAWCWGAANGIRSCRRNAQCR